MTPIEPVPTLRALPLTLAREGAVEIELEHGVLIFRVSKAAQERIEELLRRSGNRSSRRRRRKSWSSTKK
jgi:hypothetical protein